MRRLGLGIGIVLVAVTVAALPVPATAITMKGAGRSSSSMADPSSRTTTPIKHFISVMQEMRSFDSYFGTYPKADGIPSGVCMPAPEVSGSPCVKPYAIGTARSRRMLDDRSAFEAQYAMGAMSGFVTGQSTRGVTNPLPMAHYVAGQLPYYWSLARNYVLFDRYFSSAGGGSLWNHLYWVTASPGNAEQEAVPAAGYGDLATIFDRLEAKGISWKFYVQDLDRAATFRTPGPTPTQVARVPLLAFARYLDDPELAKHIVPLDQYYEDLGRSALPAVSYIVASGPSETPPASVTNGQAFVRNVIAGLKRSSAWSSSALMLSYADWGGWYDHVPPHESGRAPSGSGCRHCSSAPTPGRDTSTTRRSSTAPFSSSSRRTGGCRRCRCVMRARATSSTRSTSAVDHESPRLDLESGTPAARRCRDGRHHLPGVWRRRPAGCRDGRPGRRDGSSAPAEGPARMSTAARFLARSSLTLAIALTTTALGAPAAAAAPPTPAPRVLTIATVPPLPGVSVVLDGRTLVTGSDGTTRTLVTKEQRDAIAADRDSHLVVSTREIELPGSSRARFHGWYDGGYLYSATDRSGQTEVAAFDVSYLTSFSFVDTQGIKVDPQRVTRAELRDQLGTTVETRQTQPVWLVGRSVVSAAGRVTLRDIEYRFTEVRVDKVNVVRTRPGAIHAAHDATRARPAQHLPGVVPGARCDLRHVSRLGDRAPTRERDDATVRAQERLGHRPGTHARQVRGGDRRNRPGQGADLRVLPGRVGRHPDHRPPRSRVGVRRVRTDPRALDRCRPANAPAPCRARDPIGVNRHGGR